MFKKVLLTGVVCGLAWGFAAHADTIGQSLTFTLTQDGCTGGCGTSTIKTFGTVTLTFNGTGVDVLETLNSTSAFADTAGDSLAFDLKETSIDITGLSSAFGVVGGAYTTATKTWAVNTSSGKKGGIHEPPFGYYDYAVSCGGLGCGPGASKTDAGPLSFTINGVTLEDFSGETTTTYGDVFFSTDVIGPSGKTGDVGAKGPGVPGSTPPVVPEPSSLALLGTGALGLAGVVRRRFRRA